MSPEQQTESLTPELGRPAAQIAEDWQLGPYRIDPHAQDQVTIHFLRNGRREVYSGFLRNHAEDPESGGIVGFQEIARDILTETSGRLLASAISSALKRLYETPEHLSVGRKVWLSAPIQCRNDLPLIAVTRRCGPRGGTGQDDAPASGVASLSDAEVGALILDPSTERSRLRECLIRVEDCQFSLETSEELSLRLLDLAREWRHSSDPQDRVAVWAALRTAASMLTPDDVESLIPFLEPDSAIPTARVAAKMIGRIFTAMPPQTTGTQPRLEAALRRIAEATSNGYALESAETAALARLALVAMFASGCESAPECLAKLQATGKKWLVRQTLGDLAALRSTWEDCEQPAPAPVRRWIASLLASLNAA